MSDNINLQSYLNKPESDLKISELPKLSVLNDDDYLIIQINKQSFKITFENFKKHFISRFKIIGLGTASQYSSQQFAPFAHGHDYTDFWFFPSYGPNSTNRNPDMRDESNVTYDGKFVIKKYDPDVNQYTTSEISVYQPPAETNIKNELSDFTMYKVGDVQFVATNDFDKYLTTYRKYNKPGNNINIYGDGFDGFVVPNGDTLTCQANDFKEACKLYAGNALATSFKLPNLNERFFKLDPGLPTSQMVPMQLANGHTALPAHSHSGKCIQQSDSLDISFDNLAFTVRPSFYSGDQYSNCVHGGKGDKAMTPDEWNTKQSQLGHLDQIIRKEHMPSIEKINLDCKITGLKCSSVGTMSPTSYPTHQCIYALLYIGKK